jgi:hypothetical protein
MGHNYTQKNNKGFKQASFFRTRKQYQAIKYVFPLVFLFELETQIYVKKSLHSTYTPLN